MAVSKIALAQALHILEPSIKRTKLLDLIGVRSSPRHGHIDARYYYESDTEHVKPWKERSTEEQKAALQAAKELVGTTEFENLVGS